MMDANDIDNALHEIRQMVLVALDATDGLLRSDSDPAFFHLPAAQAEMLSFSVSDILRRVEGLKGGLYEPVRP